jgi:predicted Rossmann-fold nucleotide-binding protein
MEKIPIYLFGISFWNGLKSWLNECVKDQNAIEDKYLDLLKIEDDIEKISSEIISHLEMRN